MQKSVSALFKGGVHFPQFGGNMNIHEYQGKALFEKHGVNVLKGVHCTSVQGALDAYDNLNSKVVAVKSQIHAGGRGKGTLYSPEDRSLVMEGGVKIAFSKEDVEKYATNILGNILVTIQTGEEGKVVNNLYIESGCDICLLYTSPSPRDAHESRMPSSA